MQTFVRLLRSTITAIRESVLQQPCNPHPNRTASSAIPQANDVNSLIKYVQRKNDCNLHIGVFPPLTVAAVRALDFPVQFDVARDRTLGIPLGMLARAPTHTAVASPISARSQLLRARHRKRARAAARGRRPRPHSASAQVRRELGSTGRSL
jgi:hypothetical protein